MTPAARKALSHDDRQFLMVLHFGSGALKLRVLPDWQHVVEAGDREYIAALLSDWKQRAASDPLVLWEQVQSLSVGPLVVEEIGSDLAAHPRLASLARGFTEL